MTHLTITMLVCLTLLPAGGCAALEHLDPRKDFYSLKLYNKDFRIRELTIEGGGWQLHKPNPVTGGPNVTPNAFPPDTTHLDVSWTFEPTGERVEHPDVPIEPWNGPVGEYGREIELVISTQSKVAARFRPFAGRLDDRWTPEGGD